MQNNEFEKQVQERMGQLKYTPSAAVWEEVEKNLKQRRKRRIAIIWFLVFFIAAGGSSLAWLYLSPVSNNIVKHNTSSPEKNSKKQTPGVVSTPDQSIAASPDNKEHSKTNDTKETLPSDNVIDAGSKQSSANLLTLSPKNITSGSLVIKQKNNNLSSDSYLNIQTNSPTVKKSKSQKSSADVLTADDPIPTTKNADSIDTKDNELVNGIAVKENALTADSSVMQKDSTTNIVKVNTVDSGATSPSTVKIKTNAKPKWQFGVSVGFGMSDVVNTVSAEKSLAASAPAPPSANLSAPGTSFQNPALYILPSELNAGANFSLGFAANKKIKKRLSLGVGLQYHYYSTSIRVGANLSNSNSVVADRSNSYLAAGPRVNDFKNKYHYLELPVTMGFQLLKNKPLMFSTGVSFGRLISANVLTYNSGRGVYIEDNSNLNNYQLHILLGLSWTFGEKKSRLPIQVGPIFSYGASNLSDKSGTGPNHMYTIGAGAKIMFRKK